MTDRRYTLEARAAHRLLRRAGVQGASLRRLESWYGRPDTEAGGLAPPDGTPEGVVVDQLAELIAFFGPPGAGRGRRPPADAAACHLAVRLFPNERQRLVVTRELHLDELGDLTRVDDDAARVEVAECVAQVEASLDPNELPGWWRPWAERIANNLAAHSGMLDEPERMIFGALVQVAAAFLGGGVPYEPGYFHAMLGEDPPTVLNEGWDERTADLFPVLGGREQVAKTVEHYEGRSTLIPEQCFPGASFDLRRIGAFVRDGPPVKLAASAAAFFPVLVELRTKLDVKASDMHTKMAAAILGPGITAMSADQPVCAISRVHPVARGEPQVCVFCGAPADGQAGLTI